MTVENIFFQMVNIQCAQHLIYKITGVRLQRTLTFKTKQMKQSTKDAITVTIIIILALLGDSIFNQI